MTENEDQIILDQTTIDRFNRALDTFDAIVKKDKAIMGNARKQSKAIRFPHELTFDQSGKLVPHPLSVENTQISSEERAKLDKMQRDLDTDVYNNTIPIGIGKSKLALEKILHKITGTKTARDNPPDTPGDRFTFDKYWELHDLYGGNHKFILRAMEIWSKRESSTIMNLRKPLRIEGLAHDITSVATRHIEKAAKGPDSTDYDIDGLYRDVDSPAFKHIARKRINEIKKEENITYKQAADLYLQRLKYGDKEMYILLSRTKHYNDHRK